MPKILISSCLLGNKVRYDGNGNYQDNVRLHVWVKAGNVIAVCPEVAGGLPTPRPPAEIQQDTKRVITINGDDVTAEYVAGAERALALAKQHTIKVAILKAKSPSCGVKQVYDGSHSRKLIPGQGITAALLSEHGVQVFDETEIDAALDAAEQHIQ